MFLGFRVGARGQPDVVGELRTTGEHLRSVDHEVVAVADGGGAQRREVASCAGLGVSDREVDLALEDRGQEFRLLFVGAVLNECGPDGVQRDERQRRVHPPRFFAEDVLLECGQTAAAVLDGPCHAEQTRFAECAPALGHGVAALHQPGHCGAPLRSHDRLEALPVVQAEPLLFGGVVEVHQALAPSRTGIFFTPGTIVARSRVTSPVRSIDG